MAWSNIYLELISVTGPIVGEGLLDGWETSIELEKFDWGMTYNTDGDDPDSGGGVLGAIGGAVKGLLGIGGNRAKMNVLTFDKRFDISSAMIHTCLDKHLPIISASITVLNIKHGGRAIHEPGFVLLATDGYFTDVKLSMSSDGHSVVVRESLTLTFDSIVISYLKRVGKDNIPMNPFFYTNPKEKKSTLSVS